MDKDIEAIAEAVASKLKSAEQALCCGGLKESERDTVQGWTQQGDLFTPEQTKVLKSFIDMLMKGKKYFLIGFGFLCLYVLKDVWGAVWHFIQSLFHKGGGTWT